MLPVSRPVPWVAIGSLTAGVATLALVGYLVRHRGKPGVAWFVGVLVAQAVYCFAYGGGLLVGDPTPRLAFEVAAWTGMVWIGPLFLGFALDYTGRSDLIRSRAFATLLAVPTLTTLFVLVGPFRPLVWTEFDVVRTVGVFAADYTFEPWAYVWLVDNYVTAGLGALLLVDALLSYGPLYRRETAAVALSTVPPTVGQVAWVFDLGPAPAVNFAAVLFLPHVALDAFAFVGTNMFEQNPTTRRAAERSAIEDLPTPVVVVNPGDVVTDCNGAAEPLLTVPVDDAVGEHVDDVLAVDVEGAVEGDGYVSVHVDGWVHEFDVSRSPLTGPLDDVVGYTLVFTDVTREREREQRLGVLNRVLRHNLRNQMTVVTGMAERIERQADGDDLARSAALIVDSGKQLTAIGEKARDFDRVRERDPSFDWVDLDSLFADVVTTVDEREGRVTVETNEEGPRRVRTDETFLRLALANLLENALEHNEDPTVRLTARDATDDAAAEESLTDEPTTGDDAAAAVDGGDERTASGVVVEVHDDGAGISADEFEPILAGEEAALDHGSGIGLWVVKWSVAAIAGDLSFTSDGGGTTVSIHLPADPTDH